jgi:hypothetical protein
MLEDVTKLAFLEMLDANQVPHVHAKANNTILLKDLDSVIFCRSLEEPTRLVGSNLAWFAIDEQTYTKEQSFLRLQARLRHPRASQLCGFGACTANGFDWTYERFIGDKKTDDYEAIRATPRENIHLPSDYYDQLARSYDERFYRQEVLGEFLSLRSGTVYHAFDRARNLSPTIQYRPDAQFCWSLDFNYGLMCSVLLQIVDHAPTLHASSRNTKKVEVLDEICIKEATVDLACSTFVDRVRKLRRPGQPLTVHVYGDHSGHSKQHSGATDYNLIKQYFSRQSDFQFVYHVAEGTANPSVRDRVNAVNAALFNAHGEVRLTIHPQCQTLIKDLERVTWAHDTHGNTLNDFDKRDKSLTHVSDSLGYAIQEEFPLNRTQGGWQNQRII